MGSIPFRRIASGAIFGAALTLAGVYSPSVIISQMHFDDFHMMKAFMAASAGSALAILVAQHLHYTSIKPRTPSTLNLFSTYDGNIIGGILLGSGMTITGACPGTVLPQVATGISSGPLVLLGGVLGGVLYSKLKPFLNTKVSDKDALERPTVYEKNNLSKGNAILLYEGLCLGILGAVSWFTRENKQGEALLPPVVGGLLIGIAQMAALALTGNALGVSAAYEQVGDLFWWGVGSLFSTNHQAKKPLPKISSTFFAAGTLVGSWVISHTVSIPVPTEVVISTWGAVLGGAILTFGAKVAGGCTSGHGISGMSQLSISSIISVAAMFGGAMGLAVFLGSDQPI